MDKQIGALTGAYQLQKLTLILGEQQCHKCVRIIKERGICGAIVTVGKGTVKSTILNLLGIKSQKKEVISFLLETEKAKEVLDHFTQELQLLKPGHGIAFTTPVLFTNQDIGKKKAAKNTAESTEEKVMFKKLTVIVDRGLAEDVMDIAYRVGVKGGTIMHGRGAGADCTTRLFGVEIEPEKEMVLILTPDNIIDKLVETLTRELQLDKPGKGILFVEPVVESRGLLESNHHNDTL